MYARYMAKSQLQSEKPRLVEGNKLRCPNCEALGDPFHHFKPLRFVERYAHELNVVQIHRRDRDGCGHVFSLGEPWIIQAYLSGDLVSKKIVDELRRENVALKAKIAELEGKSPFPEFGRPPNIKPRVELQR